VSRKSLTFADTIGFGKRALGPGFLGDTALFRRQAIDRLL
jgi:hypothetical protein